MDKKYILFFWCILVCIYFIFKYRHKKQEKIIKQIKKQKNSWNYLYPFFVIFTHTPFLKKSFEKIKKRVMLVYPAEIIEIHTKVTKDMLISLAFSFSLMILFIITAKNDVYYICLGMAMTYILYTHIINLLYGASDKKLLQQFKQFLSDMNHNYYISNKKIDDAVFETIDDCPYEMSLHATKIHKILTSVPDEMQKKVDRFTSVSPNKFLLSFLAVATSIIEYGDKDVDGSSMFLTNIGFLKEEVHEELEKIKKNTFLFSFRTLIAIIPIFLIKPMQWWANEYMPEIKDYYTGVYGITCEVLIFLFAIAAYILVMNLKDRTEKEIKNHNFLRWMSKLPIVSAVLTKETNRNFSRSQRINDKLKLTGEHMGYKQFLLKRILFGIAFFVGFQIVMIGSQWQEKNNILNDYAESFSSSFISDEKTKEQMKEAAILYVKTLEKQDGIDRDALIENIMHNSSVKRPLLAEVVADTVIDKINQYNNVYYRWYFLIIGIGLFVFGFFVPVFILKYQISTIKMGMQDEVNQYQTIVMMLMHVDNMSIKIILEWMERFSYCFKESINNCINELPFDEEKALKKLRDSETFEPFKRFVNNMLIVNEQGLIAAFNEIVSERKNSLEERKSDNEIITHKKARKATFISLIPLGFALISYMIYPLWVLVNDLQSTIGF